MHHMNTMPELNGQCRDSPLKTSKFGPHRRNACLRRKTSIYVVTYWQVIRFQFRILHFTPIMCLYRRKLFPNIRFDFYFIFYTVTHWPLTL